MQIEYVGRDFELDDPIREFCAEQLSKVVPFLQEPVTAHLVLEANKHRKRAEVHVSHAHGDLRAAEETEDMRDSIHLVAEKVTKQARRSLKKFQDNRRRAAPEV